MKTPPNRNSLALTPTTKPSTRATTGLSHDSRRRLGVSSSDRGQPQRTVSVPAYLKHEPHPPGPPRQVPALPILVAIRPPAPWREGGREREREREREGERERYPLHGEREREGEGGRERETTEFICSSLSVALYLTVAITFLPQHVC